MDTSFLYNLQPRIDSFSILVPFSHVLSYPPSIDDEVLHVFSSSGELVKSSSGFFDNGDTLVRLRVTKKSLPTGVSCLSFVITAKMLGVDYFDGLSYVNFCDKVVPYLSSLGFIFSDGFFFSSYIFDIDICADFYANDDDFFSLSSLVGLANRRLFFSPVGFNDKRIVTGFSFNKREFSSISQPFVKFYTKGYDSRSFYFISSFGLSLPSRYILRSSSLSWYTYRRVECTVKNKHHFTALVKDTSLNPIQLLFDDGLLRRVFLSFLFYFGSSVRSKKISTPDTLKLTDYLIYLLAKDVSFSKSSLQFFLDKHFSSRSALEKHRAKVKLQQILTYISN